MRLALAMARKIASVLGNTDLEDEHDYKDHRNGEERGDNVSQHFTGILSIEQSLVQDFPILVNAVHDLGNQRKIDRLALLHHLSKANPMQNMSGDSPLGTTPTLPERHLHIRKIDRSLPPPGSPVKSQE